MDNEPQTRRALLANQLRQLRTALYDVYQKLIDVDLSMKAVRERISMLNEMLLEANRRYNSLKGGLYPLRTQLQGLNAELNDPNTDRKELLKRVIEFKKYLFEIRFEIRLAEITKLSYRHEILRMELFDLRQLNDKKPLLQNEIEGLALASKLVLQRIHGPIPERDEGGGESTEKKDGDGAKEIVDVEAASSSAVVTMEADSNSAGGGERNLETAAGKEPSDQQ